MAYNLISRKANKTYHKIIYSIKRVLISEQQYPWTVIIAANKTTRALRIIMHPLA